MPLYPLIHDVRKVDIMFTFDNSADKNGPMLTHWCRLLEDSLRNKVRSHSFQLPKSLLNWVSIQDQFFIGYDTWNLKSLADIHDKNMNKTDIPLVV